MDIASHIPGVANTGTEIPGVNTPAPYNVPFIGFVDGTGPQNASKNMAEIYNRPALERAALIQTAGLAIDNDNWVQSVQAISLLSGGRHGGTCPVTGPAAAPTAASPYTRYTSTAPYLEEWAWNGLSWCVIGKFYGEYQGGIPTLNFTGGVDTTIKAVSVPRNGTAHLSVHANVSSPTATQGIWCRIYINGILASDNGFLANAIGQPLSAHSSITYPVTAGSTILYKIYTGAGNLTGVSTHAVFQYTS